jgi:hypothetical protein
VRWKMSAASPSVSGRSRPRSDPSLGPWARNDNHARGL